VGRRAQRAAARENARAEDSAFRRHWTRRDRLVVAVAGAAIAWVLRVVYWTLRFRCDDVADVLGRHARGERFVLAAWHDGIPLFPLVLVRVGRGFRPRVLLSWHRDAEIAAQAVRRFGVEVIRGSSTRGRVGGVRGLLQAYARGEDLVVVPDGPRGPRHLAKGGVVQLARATGLPVVPVGLAVQPVRRLRSWDRMQIPLPFARAAAVIGPPVPVDALDAEAALVAVQAAMAAADGRAAAHVGVGGA